jgi:hypothetical protein
MVFSFIFRDFCRLPEALQEYAEIEP